MSTTQLNLFDILQVASDLTIDGDAVNDWVQEIGSEPSCFRIETPEGFYRFQDQLVDLGDDGGFIAETLGGNKVLMVAMITRPVSVEDVLTAFPPQPVPAKAVASS